MLKKLQKLNRKELKNIKGGSGIGPCDIGPVGCPCEIPPGHPCLGGGDPGDPGSNYGYCPDDQSYIPCDQYCPNGLQPLCAI
ncbi:hypothetical protein [Chryseobacterium gossypii]|uniref:hypothetical protein n=1 Tax=Chryseobacterium gossypii TaxID=3231602 RepID=UPI003526A036